MSTIPNTISLFLSEAFSNIGVNATQGSHQGAQKSTITKSFASIVFLKFFFVSLTVAIYISQLNLVKNYNDFSPH